MTVHIWICDVCRKCFDEQPNRHGYSPPNSPYEACHGIPIERLLVDFDVADRIVALESAMERILAASDPALPHTSPATRLQRCYVLACAALGVEER